MRSPRETIYNALLAELRTVLTNSPNTFQTFSRVWRPHTDYAAAQLPACVLDEPKESYQVEALAAAPLVRLKVDCWLYLQAPVVSQVPGAEPIIPMTALNNALDTLDSALGTAPLANPPFSGMPYNTLGGLVIHTWIEGDILKIAGVGSSQTQYSLARVPIVIFTT